MKKKMLMSLAIVLGVGALACAADEDFAGQAKRIHEKAIVVDVHCHPLLHSRRSRELFAMGIDNPHSQTDFVKMDQGGVDAAVWALPIFYDEDEDNPSKLIFKGFREVRDEIDKCSDRAGMARTAEDIRRLNAAGRKAVLLTVETPDFMEGCLELLDVYARMGAVSIVLNELDGISAKAANGGATLSELGKSAVKRMNELGIIIDITHLPDSLQKEVLGLSSRPVIASHSNARALNDVPRNIPDEILKIIAAKGGAVMVTFYSGWVDHEYYLAWTRANEEFKRREKELQERFKGNEPELEQKLAEIRKGLLPADIGIARLIDHIDHMARLVGADHVGIGSDWGGDMNPIGLASAADMPHITAELLKRGHSEDELIKILGGNFLRILAEVQSKAE
jgi:membrane dipeptidase